ncbi:hypothetical protein BJX62DRAFT_243350 [Aspergillus germanicus]
MTVPTPISTGTANTSIPRLLELATTIVHQTALLTAHLETNSLPEPTFTPDAAYPAETPKFLSIHRTLSAALDTLQYLVDGPHRTLRTLLCRANDLAAFQVAFDFGFFTLIPRDGEMALEEIAARTGVDADRAGRCLRMMATHRVFVEKSPGVFAHTAASWVLGGDEDARCAGHYLLDEMWKAATRTSECLKIEASARPTPTIDAIACTTGGGTQATPFSVHFGVPMFTYYAQKPEYAARFAKAMAGATKVDRQITELCDEFPWDTLEGTVVDVGGGSGHVSMELAKVLAPRARSRRTKRLMKLLQKYPKLNFIIQDASPDMLAQGRAILSTASSSTTGDTASLSSRITFTQHDFLTPQPVRNAAAFIIRQCTHNWSDADVVRIFQSLVPGLEGSVAGTPLLINDTILPEAGAVSAYEERALRQMDMLMMVGLGAKQRSRREFVELLKRADERFVVKRVRAEGSMGLLEVVLRTAGETDEEMSSKGI